MNPNKRLWERLELIRKRAEFRDDHYLIERCSLLLLLVGGTGLIDFMRFVEMRTILECWMSFSLLKYVQVIGKELVPSTRPLTRGPIVSTHLQQIT